ncbi:hypothetical protein LINPERPRIM_LOCUS926 [Linum perenne]
MTPSFSGKLLQRKP